MARPRLTRILAPIAPPAVVLASVHQLYLRNQAELGWTVSVLFPFWATSLAAITAALLLQRMEGRLLGRVALWAYYLCGLLFIVWGFLRALPLGAHFARWFLDTGSGTALYGLLCLGVIFAAARQGSPRRIEATFAVFAVALCARESAVLASRLEQRPPPPTPRNIIAEVGTGNPALPNIYHLLLDAFPDELLEPCLPAETTVLDGFVRFHLASPQRSTRHVLPSIFTGRWEPGATNRLHEAFVGETSLFTDLRHAGYRTLALVPRYIYAEHPSAVDVMVFHEDAAPTTSTSSLQATTFRQLWLVATLPTAIAEPLARRSLLGLDAATFDELQDLRAATRAWPVLSRGAMERLSVLEPLLQARGRYTLVHLGLPHPPFVLRADCGDAGARVATDLKQQTECTLRLVTRFLELLRASGRLDGAIVLIHGDHGPGDTLVHYRPGSDSPAQLRTVLLVKPARARGTFRAAGREARLVDIAPTLLALAGVRVERRFDGALLDDIASGETARDATQ